MLRCYRQYLRCLLLATVLVVVSNGLVAYAQEGWVPVRVTYVAGLNVYLDAGRDQHLMRGDTLALYQEETVVGRLVVISSISDRSVATFAEAPFPLTRGVVFHVRGSGLLSEGAIPLAQELDVASRSFLPPPAASAINRPVGLPPAATPRRRARPHATGRVQVSLQALQSRTSWEGAPSGTATRSFVTPSVSAHLTLQGLPQGVHLRTRFRADYRYSSARPIDPALSVRAYEVMLEKQVSSFVMQAGRFANRFTPYSGYWDGVLLHYDGTHVGFGTVLGFLPDQSNEGFSSEMPRYSGFARLKLGERTGRRYLATVSFNEIRPTNHLLDHRFAGLSQRFRWGVLTLRNDLQLDRDPISNRWVASRFHVRGSLAPVRGLRLHGRYYVRQPYSIYRVQRVIAYRRDQAQAGVSLHILGATVGADAALHYINDDGGGRLEDGRTVSGYVQVPRTGVFALSWGATASYWQDDDGSSFFLTTGLTRGLGRARVRLQYQYYDTETLAGVLVTHAMMMHTTIPLGRKFYTSVQARLQQSTTLSSMAFYTSLWYTF